MHKRVQTKATRCESLQKNITDCLWPFGLSFPFALWWQMAFVIECLTFTSHIKKYDIIIISLAGWCFHNIRKMDTDRANLSPPRNNLSSNLQCTLIQFGGPHSFQYSAPMFSLWLWCLWIKAVTEAILLHQHSNTAISHRDEDGAQQSPWHSVQSKTTVCLNCLEW